jgi:cell division protein FtsB
MKKIFRRRFNPRPMTPRRKLTLGLLAALPVLAIFTFGNRGILKRLELEMEYTSLYNQLYSDRAAGDSLKREIVRMKNDTVAIERLARERFGMVRPGESIYRVEE